MDHPAESAITEGTVQKPPSRLGLGLGAIVVVIGSLFAVLGGSDGQPLTPTDDVSDVASERAPSTTIPISTALTQANGADTAANGSDTAANGAVVSEVKLPDRGAFREALAATFVASCDGLIDGPEPISAGLYREHGRCVTEALIGLDDRCKLAAAVFYVLPSEEALNVACDIQEEPQRFRESIRQGMVITCDLQRDIADPEHDAYYEYDRCLQGIADQLDQTCYLSARAQFQTPSDLQVREICEIALDARLESTIE